MNTNHSEPRSLLASRLDTSATILLIVVTLFVGGLTAWDRARRPTDRAAPPEPPLPTGPVSTERAPIRGDRNAKIAVIDFSEFEYPYYDSALGTSWISC